MSIPASPERRCAAGNCRGKALSASETCFAHADDAHRAEALATFGETGYVDFTSAIDLSANDVAQILEAAPRGDAGPILRAADFSGTRFTEAALFKGVTFEEGVYFLRTFCEDDLYFTDCTFPDDALFLAMEVAGDVDIRDTRFGTADFDESVFGGEVHAQASFAHGVSFTRAEFEGRVRLRLTGGSIDFSDASFRGGGELGLQSDAVRLDGARVLQPLTLGPPGVAEDERRAAPVLLSLRSAHVGGLVLSGVDLSRCRMAGAHELDELRIESRTTFAAPPAAWHPQRRWPPLLRYTRRQCLADEHDWRHQREGGLGWMAPATHPLGAVAPPPALEIAGLYRALRKGREDSKDSPGAADFYYGEMEMRRKAGRDARSGTGGTSLGERAVLHVYWFLCGYGLRPARAFSALLATLVAATLLMTHAGLADRPTAAVLRGPSGATTVQLAPDPASSTRDASYGSRLERAWWLCVDAAVIRAPAPNLTAFGRRIELALRVLGPLLLALAILSLRGRIAR